MANVTSGDVERCCLGQDPTCTGINQCLACWEHHVLTCLMPAMRDGGFTATDNQVRAFFRRYREGVKSTLRAVRQEHPGAFDAAVAVRRPMLEKAWQEVRDFNLPEPTYSFAQVAVEQGPATAGQAPPAPPSQPRGAAPSGVPTAGGIPIGVPLGNVGRSRGNGGEPPEPRFHGVQAPPGTPTAGGIPIGVPLGNIGGSSGGSGRGDPPEPTFDRSDDGDDVPLARGDVRRIAKHGTRTTRKGNGRSGRDVPPTANGGAKHDDAPLASEVIAGGVGPTSGGDS